MKRKILTRVNVILGAVSMVLAGCHSGKKAAQNTPPRPMLKYGVPTEVRAMYGVPADVLAPVDSTAAPKDTVAVPEEKPARPRDREILVKYGVPGSFNQ